MAEHNIVDQMYLDRLDPKQLRDECERALEFELSFTKALRELPEENET